MDEFLLKLLHTKPEKGLEKLIDTYAGLVYTIIYSKLNPILSKEDIEECSSAVFYEIFNNRDSIDLNKGSLKAFIAVVAKRKAIDMLRRNIKITKSEVLLEKLNFDIDKKTKNKINSMTINKAGISKAKISKKRFFNRKSTASAAIILIVFTFLFIANFDGIVEALGKYFAFIPDYGIIENNKTIEYVIDGKNLKAENSDYIMYIGNALATKNTVNIFLRIEEKNYDEEAFMKKKQEEWEMLIETDEMKEDGIFLIIGDKKYNISSFSSSGGGKTTDIYADFEVKPEDINTQEIYKIGHVDYDLSLQFKLKRYDSFDSLEEIGSTGYNNNISITAIATKHNNMLEVELYAINKTEDIIHSFNNMYDSGYMGKDLHLITNTGEKEYTTSDGYANVNNKFYFNLSKDDKDFVLNIPHIVVKNNESEKVSLKIPNKGEKITINKEINFKDSIVKITEVERVITEGNEHGALKIYFEYENTNENKILNSFHLNRINILGITQSGSYSADIDENGVLKSICYDLEEGEDKILRISIENPVYYLLGQYNLELEVD